MADVAPTFGVYVSEWTSTETWGDDFTRLSVPMLSRPWVLHVCHAQASCHFRVACTLHMMSILLVSEFGNLSPLVAAEIDKMPSAQNLPPNDMLVDANIPFSERFE